MPVPVNSTPNAAILISSFPYTNTQQVDDGTTAYSAWYKFVSDGNGISAFPYGDASVYTPYVQFWYGDDPNNLNTWFGDSQIRGNPNVPTQIAAVDGQTFYIEVVPLHTANVPANLTLNVHKLTPATAPIESILVPDDTPEFPAIIISSINGDDYNVLQLHYPFPPGESGDILDDGTICVEDNSVFPANAVIYDNQLNLLHTVAMPATGSLQISANKTQDCFYVGIPGGGSTHASIHKLTKSGVLTAVGHLSSAGLTGLAVSPDGTIAYIAGVGGSLNSQVGRWDLTSDTALSNLAPDEGGTVVIGQQLCLTDGSVLSSYRQSSPYKNYVKHWSSAGTLLNTYDFSGSAPSGSGKLIAYGINNTTEFWVWLKQTTTGIDVFQKIRISDGSVLSSVQHVEFEAGTAQFAATPTPVTYFGMSFSCPFIPLRVAIIPPTPPPSSVPTGIAVTGCVDTILVSLATGSNGCTDTIPTY